MKLLKLNLVQTSFIFIYGTFSSASQPIQSLDCLKCHKGTQIAKDEPGHGDLKFQHMKDIRSCSLCHRKSKVGELVLLDGAPISLENSSRVCGQCHGVIYEDWKGNIHGKRTGLWKGKGEKLACTNCHNAHNPKFQPMRADKPPQFPLLGIPKNSDSMNMENTHE